jgi:L-malate glycosyltransferase
MKRKTVSLIQTRLPDYRVPVFDSLRDRLMEQNIRLQLIHSTEDACEKLRKDEGRLSWATVVPARRCRIGNTEFVWQSALKHLSDSSLVIFPQENRLLLNYLLFLRKPFIAQKLALWGHGKNMKSDHRMRDRWKNLLGTLPDWWFGYTEVTREILVQRGFSEQKITIFQNSIDTRELRSHAAQVKLGDLEALRKKLGLSGRQVGIFCGSIYPGKRLDLILEASLIIRKSLPEFELVIIGAGPDEESAVAACKSHHWVRYVGHKSGAEKALYLKLGHLFLLPHTVGLAIIDAFALGLPLLTMGNRTHGPELAYLRQNANGVITDDTTEAFAAAAVLLLRDPAKLKTMSAECLRDAESLSAENMAMNIARGIVACLES